MKTLLTTTAALCFGTIASAETAYFTEVDESSVFGSDYIGMSVYPKADAQNTAREAVGEINDLVIGNDGTVQAILMDIGGFIGIAEHNIALKPEMVTIQPDFTTRSDLTDRVLLVEGTAESLKEIPEFEWISNSLPQAMPFDPDAPDESYARSVIQDVTAEELTGAPVYDLNGAWVGEVSELLIYADTSVSTAIVDVGGFLGIGEKPVELSTDQLIVLRPVADQALEVRLTATEEELELMPAYEG